MRRINLGCQNLDQGWSRHDCNEVWLGVSFRDNELQQRCHYNSLPNYN